MFFILRLTPLLPYGTILFSPPPYFLSKTKEHNKKKGKWDWYKQFKSLINPE
jgi:hypothetical protein